MKRERVKFSEIKLANFTFYLFLYERVKRDKFPKKRIICNLKFIYNKKARKIIADSKEILQKFEHLAQSSLS